MPSRTIPIPRVGVHTIRDWRRGRRRVMPNVGWELWLGLEVGREHMRIHPLDLRRSAVLVIVFLVVRSAIEVGGALVLVWTSVLSRRVSERTLGCVGGEHYIGVPRHQLPHVT